MSKRATLVDVTLRDGGYINGHRWSTHQACTIVSACSAAGIPYTEVGYVRPGRHHVDADRFPSASCPPEYLARLQEVAGPTGLVVMAHAADVVPENLVGLARFGVRLVRMPTRPDKVLDLKPYAEAAHSVGMEFSVNLIRVSELTDGDVAEAATASAEIPADVFYIADSNGSLFPEDVVRLMDIVRRSALIAVGMHTHDGMSMGFSNTLTAMRLGAEFIDASLCGMGKGGGNLALELITAYLRIHDYPELTVTPLVETAAALLGPWKGPGIVARCEAMVSGLLDLNLERLQEIRDQGPGRIFAHLDRTLWTA